MKKSAIVFLLFSFLLTSCGAKKNVAMNVESTPGETEANEVVTSADTLPEFLREFANDSTIHINWAYGIPFIIDDSVPMFLPPIDKNPEGYVSSDNYRTIIEASLGCQAYARNKWDIDKCSACGVANPMDSLLWLNKCVNDLLDFCSFENNVLYPSHDYTYIFSVITIDNQQIIQVYVQQKVRWEYLNSRYPQWLQTELVYFFNCEGNLLGSMHAEVPLQIVHPSPKYKPIPLRESIPDYNKFKNYYFSTITRKSLGVVVLTVIAPGTLNSAEI